MVDQAFRLRQRVYLADGGTAEFVVKVEDGPYIVRPVFDTYNGAGDSIEEYADGLVEVAMVYPKPPRAKLDADIVDLNAKADALRAEIRELETEKRTFGQDHAERAARIAKHEQLATLDRFLAGEITHCVMQSGWGSGIKIMTLADALDVPEDDRYSRRQPEMKLLSLFGASNGDLSWRISQYRDGSGHHWTEMVPCVSEEEARAVVADRLDVMWAKYRNADREQVGALKDGIEAASSLGIAVPDDILADLAAHRKEAAARAIAKAEAELAAARAKAGEL